MPAGDVVAARREYAAHLGVELSGNTQNGERPGHIEWAVANNNHVPDPVQPVNLGSAVPLQVDGRFFIVRRPDGATLMEGALQRVMGSEYERNAAARTACIAAHGCECAVCRFSFEKAYGAMGAGFIHVHHLTPLASQGENHAVDPVRDLIPVCPNCHAMLHRQDPPLEPQKLRELMHG
ncbi:HNH endonuclease [Ramlibacter sp. AW1]|uniref:HNH endonuclease n=1 Tax=Ramlibacter aurantiacus TaxID=2801330 RepID=A0A937D8H6_9BURK|nr:HNH endonuclease [Ramlibacter aurantiacus]MBL0423068.1 HNH endonuclease [Ramlibacter aurantiacus]